MRVTVPETNAFNSLLTQFTGQTIKTPVMGIATDSRECSAGDLYIALKGQHVDGYDFIQQAIEQNAAAVLSNKQFPIPAHVSQLIDADPLRFIGQFAHSWRKSFKIPVIGITGSNGKTTTKELLQHFLSAKETVHATTGNFNSSIGLPLTLFELTNRHTISILEMGANQPGDIAYLSKIAEPTHGLITNVAPAHLEGFGTIEAVAKTKRALFDFLTNGTCFVNMNDDFIRSFPVRGQSVTFGFSTKCDYPVQLSNASNGSTILKIASAEILIDNTNPSFIKNIIAAGVVANYFGVGWETIGAKVKTFKAPKGRCEIKNFKDITVIDDTYNANLTSTLAAIDYLMTFKDSGRKILIFGDMFELGAESFDQHRQVGQYCKKAGLDAVFSIGNESIATHEAMNGSIFHMHFETKPEMLSFIKGWIVTSDKILVKGSRGMSMESIVAGLKDH